VRRLLELLEHADWRLEAEIEECLVRLYSKTAKTVATIIRSGALHPGDRPTPTRTHEVLTRMQSILLSAAYYYATPLTVIARCSGNPFR
jgi:hypothetical protein